MKKLVFIAIFSLFSLFFLASQQTILQVPQTSPARAQTSTQAAETNQGQSGVSLKELSGVWENDSRFITVNEDSLDFVLKTFYGFYYDRAATLKAELGTGESGETVLRVKYDSSKHMQPHPIGVINDKLFLNFYCRGSSFPNEESVAATAARQINAAEPNRSDNGTDEITSPLYGYWRACGNVDAIEIAEPTVKRELLCYYFTNTEAYLIRYWRADVPYEKVSALATDGAFSFTVDKLLTVGDTVYTCVTGRGITIRNLQKVPYYIEENALILGSTAAKELFLSEDGSLMSLSRPFVTKANIDDMDALIAEHNSRTHNPLLNPLAVFERETAWEKKLKALK